MPKLSVAQLSAGLFHSSQQRSRCLVGSQHHPPFLAEFRTPLQAPVNRQGV